MESFFTCAIPQREVREIETGFSHAPKRGATIAQVRRQREHSTSNVARLRRQNRKSGIFTAMFAGTRAVCRGCVLNAAPLSAAPVRSADAA